MLKHQTLIFHHQYHVQYLLFYNVSTAYTDYFTGYIIFFSKWTLFSNVTRLHMSSPLPPPFHTIRHQNMFDLMRLLIEKLNTQ